MDLLLFRLYGPMASWGEIAVGENRHTANYPSKSALLGLVGAALGIERDDEERQQQLQQGYTLAVEVLSAGQLLRDYHTAQVPDSVGKFVYRTRRDELILGKERLGTILSSREYRSDALALIAIRALQNAPYSLEAIQDKLLRPVFHLYLGRKSCPLAAPLDPQLLANQANFFAGFKAYCHKPLLSSSKDSYWLNLSNNRHYYWEGLPEDFADSQALDLNRRQTRVRHDQPFRAWRREDHALTFP